jgi:microcystin degradation protein MlrC
MKIFAAGIATETNTFSPLPTAREDFLIQRGRDVLEGRIEYPSLNLADIWGKQAQAHGDEFVFGFMAWAQPGGTTLKSAYESLREELLNDLRGAMRVDVVLLMLHGAMVAQDYDDCEEDLIRRVRQIVGPEPVIAVELDLHCHLSDSLLAEANIVITYKEYPHVDGNEGARELFDLARRTKLGSIRPTMALFDCQMIGLYPTTRQPLRGFVNEMIEAEHLPGVLSISFGHGFQYADVPHVGSEMLVVTDGDRLRAARLARELGRKAYGLRRQIGFESLSLPLDVALTKALASQNAPVVIADQPDNTGGGAPGDATFALRWLLEHDASCVAMAIFYDPEVVRISRQAGIGATLNVSLGGKMGSFSGVPLDIRVTVRSMLEHYMHSFPQESGDPLLYLAGDVVALRGGGIDLVVSSERCQCFSPSIFTDLGIDPTRKRLLVAQSVQHFYGAFAPIAGEVIYMAARGAVSPDPRLIGYRRFDPSNVFPWADDPLGEAARNSMEPT